MTFCGNGAPGQNTLTTWQLLRLSLEMPPLLLSYIISDVQEFACTNSTRLSPLKCKVMSVDFLHFNSYQCPPVDTGGVVLEHVGSFKLLGVYILKIWLGRYTVTLWWGLFALRSLRLCGVPASEMILVYTSLVRSILECTCVVFSNLPLYLSDSIEKV